ncbi:MAG: choice-of-anchor D domain-containing protein, partial [Nevskiaceae bacterium]
MSYRVVAQPQTTITLTAAAPSVAVGKTTTLRWTSNADSCVASGGWTGTFSGRQALSGSQVVGPLSNRDNQFTLTCSGPGGSASRSVTVQALPAPSIKLQGSAVALLPGESLTLEWSAADATSCSASGGWTGNKDLSGTESLPNQTRGNKTFTLSCRGIGGSTKETVRVSVAAAPAVTFTAAATAVLSGRTTSLRWRSTDATECTASGDWSGVKGRSGSEPIGPIVNEQYVYTLTCKGPTGEDTETVIVEKVDPPTLDLTLDKYGAKPGESVVIRWTSTDVQSCQASGAWSGPKAASGQETLSNFTSNGKRTYNLSCKGGGGSVRDSVVLEVTPPPTISFSASPAEVTEGAAASLRWSAQDATTCVASGDWTGDRGRSGSASTGPLNKIESTFTLTCTGANGSSSSTVKIKVLPPPDVQFTLSSPSASPNSSITLNWSSANATSCRASGGAWSGERSTAGSLVIPNLTPGDKKFTLTCTGSGGSTVIDRTLIVSDPPKITLTADKTTVASGGSVTLSWTVTNAESCLASGQWSDAKNKSGGSETVGPLTRRSSDFILTCRGRAGDEASVTRTVSVTGTAEIESFTAASSTIKAGGRATLTWSSTGASECAAGGDWSGSRPTSGTATTDALAQGERNFTLTCSNAGNSDLRTVKVNVIAPTGELTPSTLAFGEQAAGAVSTPRNVVLRNTSTVTLGISGFAFLGANAGEFTQTNDCPSLINPQATCTIAVTFSPTSGGNKAASLRIASDSQTGAITVGLTGTAVAAARIALSTASLNFGSQTVAVASEGRAITLKNEGNAPLAISGLVVGGAAAAQFSQANDCPASLAVGATCTVTVRFTPADPGAKAATLAVNSNAANGVANIALAGEGASVPVAVLGATTVNFDRVAVGSTGATRQVQLRNAGGAALTLTAGGFTLAGADAASFSQTNDCPESLAPNATCTVNVRFAPASFGSKSATINVASNAPGGAASATLAGIGTQAVLAVSTESLDFGDQVVSIASTPRTVTVTNSGNVAATLSPLDLLGADKDAFALTSTCGASLVEGQSCTATLTFTPGSIGGKSALLKITGAGFAKDVFISGFGANDRKPIAGVGGPVGGASGSGAYVWTPPGKISKLDLPGGVRLFRNRAGIANTAVSAEPRVFRIAPNGDPTELTFRDREGKDVTQDVLKVQSIVDLESFQIIKVRDVDGRQSEYLTSKKTGAAYLTEGLEWNAPKLLANGSIVARKGSQLFIVDTGSLSPNPAEILRGRFVPSVDAVTDFEVSEADDFIVYAGSTSTGSGASTGVCRIYDLKASAEMAFNNVSRFVPGANDSGGWGTCLWMRNPVTGQLLFPDSTKKSDGNAVYVPIVRRADGSLGAGEPQTFSCSYKLSETNGGRLSTTAEQFPNEKCKHTNSGLAFRKRGRWVGDQHFFGTDSKFISQVDFDSRKIIWRDDLNAAICAGCADQAQVEDDNWWLQSAATAGFVWMACKDRNDRFIVARLDPSIAGANAVRTITFNDVEVGEIRPIGDDTVLFKGRQLNPLANVAGTAEIKGDVLIRSKVFTDVDPEEFDIRIIVEPQSAFRLARFKATGKVTGEAGGQIVPGVIEVAAGRQGSFQITPPSRAGVGLIGVSGCNGSLNGVVYTTGPMTVDCVVTAEFGAVTAAPKQIRVTASELFFEPIVLAVTSPTQSFTVLNTGTAAVAVASISVTGAQVNDFALTQNCPASLAVGSSCVVTARFSPTAAGERSASVTITSDAANGAQSVKLTGIGLAINTAALGDQAATAAVSAEALKMARPTLASGVYWFDPDGVGGQAAFQAYADLTTAGGGWLQVRRIPGAGSWYSQNDNLAGTTALSASSATNRLANTEWSLAFAPYVDANTEFLFATGVGDTWCVLRRGTSIFDGQASLTTRASQVIASSNTAITAGGFTNVLARSANAEDPWIGCQGDHNANTSRMLYGENATTVHTSFKNSANGINVFARKLRVTANGVTLSPAAINFGTVEVNSTSAPQVLTLTNTGSAAVELRRVFAAGFDSAQFVVTHNCGNSLAAQASCTVTVRLSPLAAGVRSATLVVDTSASRLTSALSSTGRTTRLVLSSDAPATGVKSGETVTLSWESTGLASCTASGDWSGVKPVAGSERSGVLVGNAIATSRTFRLECIQEGGGALTSAVTVPVAAALEIAPATLAFGDLTTGATSTARAVVITNRSVVAFGAPVVSLDGVDAAMFSQTSNCPNLLAPGQTCTVSIAFRPTAAGARAARVVVSGRLNTDGRLSEGQVTSPSTQRFFADNGHIYEFVTSGASWTQARALAESRRLAGNPGYLATITSDAEMAFVKKAYTDGVLKGDSIWLGASDAAVEGQWRWVTGPDAGATIAQNLWVAGEPNNSGDEDYGALGYFGRGMNDLPDRENAPWISGYLVEYSGGAAVESSVAVTGTGLAGALSGDTAQTAVSSAAQLKSLRPTAPSGLYWFDPDGAGGNPAFRTYADMTTAGGGWMQVRRIPGSGNWYSGNDDLGGGAALNPVDSDKINHTGSWSLKFDYFVDADTEYLFAAGNSAAWCVLRRGTDHFGATSSLTTTGSRVVASRGTRIAAGGLTNVLVRPGSNDDPWIGCEGDHASNQARALYGENGNANNLAFKNANNGINVFVRKAAGARLGSINGGISLSDDNRGPVVCSTAPGAVCRGGVSAVLRNLGSQVLPRPQFSVRGADAAAFTVSPSCGASIEPGADCSVGVLFNPLRAGRHSAELVWDGVAPSDQWGTVAVVNRSSSLNGIKGVALDTAGNIYFSEYLNGVIRKIDAQTGAVSVLISGLPGVNGLAFDSQNRLYAAVGSAHVVVRIDVTNGNFVVVAGTANVPGNTGDAGPASQATITDPTNVLVDRLGRLFITQDKGGRLRMVEPNGTIYTVTETGVAEGLALDSRGNVYFGDNSGHRIRRISGTVPTNGSDLPFAITTVAGNGSLGST